MARVRTNSLLAMWSTESSPMSKAPEQTAAEYLTLAGHEYRQIRRDEVLSIDVPPLDLDIPDMESALLRSITMPRAVRVELKDGTVLWTPGDRSWYCNALHRSLLFAVDQQIRTAQTIRELKRKLLEANHG